MHSNVLFKINNSTEALLILPFLTLLPFAQVLSIKHTRGIRAGKPQAPTQTGK
jgi:hypothetical protein